MIKAYRGANGWYVAREKSDGSHRQPSLGPWLTEAEARAEAQDGNDCEAEERWEQETEARREDI